MSTHSIKRMPAVLSLTVLGLLALPEGGAYAQDKTPPPPPDKKDATGTNPPASDTNDPTLKKVSLDLESTNLYSALKLLFDHIDANYFLDPSLKNAEVSVHLHNVPFKIVLDTLVKSTGLPLTWKLEANIYRIVPKEVETTAPPEEGRLAPSETPDSKAPKIVLLSRDSFAFDGLSIAEALGGKPFSIFPRTFDYNPFPGTQSTTGASTQNRGGGLGGGSGGTGGAGGTGGGTGGSSFGGGGLGGSGTGSGRSGF